LAAVVLLFATGVLFQLGRRYWGILRKKSNVSDEPGHVPETEWRPTPAAARLLLEECDALAAEGRYSEAVHLLLLRSIEDIEERRPRLVRPALTSREIGSLAAVPASARADFGRIARTVEHALFAGNPVDSVQFTHCRREYESFVFAPVWRSDGGH
jgi:hypothetical protein